MKTIASGSRRTSMGIIAMALIISVPALSGCETTKKVSVDEVATRPTYEGAEVAIPIALGRDDCRGYVSHKCLERLTPNSKLPVIVYIHGCDGPNAEAVRRLLTIGYIVVAPNSLQRDRRKVDCEPGSDKQTIMRLRFEEAAYAAKMLSVLPWVDQSKLVLSGFSEGGVTAALYPGDEYAARIILAWTCTSGLSFWQGLRGPRVPTLAIVGSVDHYYQNPYNRGKCNVSGRPSSKSIILRDVGHNIIVLDEVWGSVGDFLTATVAKPAGE